VALQAAQQRRCALAESAFPIFYLRIIKWPVALTDAGAGDPRQGRAGQSGPVIRCWGAGPPYGDEHPLKNA
jgi:hypothetical protein